MPLRCTYIGDRTRRFELAPSGARPNLSLGRCRVPGLAMAVSRNDGAGRLASVPQVAAALSKRGHGEEPVSRFGSAAHLSEVGDKGGISMTASPKDLGSLW